MTAGGEAAELLRHPLLSVLIVTHNTKAQYRIVQYSTVKYTVLPMIIYYHFYNNSLGLIVEIFAESTI